MGARRHMNLFGIDVTGLDVAAWTRGAQVLYAVAALAWLGLVFARRSPRLLLAGVLLANAWVFLATNWPLQRLYALGPSRDRLNNVGLCQVVAAGSPMLETSLPGQVHFEPFWGLLMAVLSGFDPQRLLRVYAFMPLVTVLAFVLALEWGLRRGPPADGAARDGAADAWERAIVAGFATLLCAAPLDYLSGYRVTWAMMFLLKPNHALGLALLPVVLRFLDRARGWRGCVATGLLLHVMGWAFVIHMGLTAVGLCVYVLLSWAGRGAWRRDLRDVSVVLGVNLAVVSPYLYMLVTAHPFLVPHARAIVPAWSPHLLEVTVRAGFLFPLAVWGAWRLWRRGDRLGRLWAAQALSALLMWGACQVLGYLRMARELDEFYYWAHCLVAACAGVGAWDLARRAWAWWRAARPGAEAGTWIARPAVALALVVLPLTLPYWWDPARMDPLFPESLEPLPAVFAAPTAWLRENSAPGDVVAGDDEYMPWVSALGARRVLLSARLNAPGDFTRRSELLAALLRGDNPDAARQVREQYGVRFLLVTPEWLAVMGVELAELMQRRDLRLAHLTRASPRRYVAVFRVEPVTGHAAAPPRGTS